MKLIGSLSELPRRYRYKEEISWDESVAVKCYTYYVIRDTPCGEWLIPEGYPFDSAKKWRRKGAHRIFASASKRTALESFCARKRRQMAILREQFETAERAWKTGSHMLKVESEREE